MLWSSGCLTFAKLFSCDSLFKHIVCNNAYPSAAYISRHYTCADSLRWYSVCLDTTRLGTNAIEQLRETLCSFVATNTDKDVSILVENFPLQNTCDTKVINKHASKIFNLSVRNNQLQMDYRIRKSVNVMAPDSCISAIDRYFMLIGDTCLKHDISSQETSTTETYIWDKNAIKNFDDITKCFIKTVWDRNTPATLTLTPNLTKIDMYTQSLRISYSAMLNISEGVLFLSCQKFSIP